MYLAAVSLWRRGMMMQNNDAAETVIVTMDPIKGYHSPNAVLATVQTWLKLKTVASIVSDKERDQSITTAKTCALRWALNRYDANVRNSLQYLVPLLVADE